MTREVFERLVSAPPKLHYWGDEWRVGGLGARQVALLEKSAKSLGDEIRVIETGAGLSTLLLLALDATVTSFFTKSDLSDRIANAITEYGLPKACWCPILGSSEFTFPKFLDMNPETQCELVLIDGGHLIHTVFTDFTYGYASLKQDGIMLIDDIQTAAVSVLYNVLKASTFMEEIGSAGKTVAFRKKEKARLPGAVGDFQVSPEAIAESARNLDDN